jgi:hypothetical protein
MPILMHQMRISTNQVSFQIFKSFKVNIFKNEIKIVHVGVLLKFIYPKMNHGVSLKQI